MNHFENLACPICSSHLELVNKSFICSSKHCFDLSAKGYVNLLMSQDKNSKEPGDSKEMVIARRRFLEKGFYQALAEALAQETVNLIDKRTGNNAAHILDAGCGEGYYTGYIRQKLLSQASDATVMGMDISKEAVKSASSHYKGIGFCVASLFKLPLLDQSQDIVFNVFAPSCDSEFSRIIKKSGTLMVVIPGKYHLYGLKGILYDSPTYNDEQEPELPSFVAVSKIRIRDTVTIEGKETLKDLLSMTPYYWRTPESGISRLEKMDTLTTDIDFLIIQYRLNSVPSGFDGI